MYRLLVLAALLTGCGFAGAPGTPGEDIDDPEELPDGTEPVAISALCSDPAVRLCLDFDDLAITDGTVYEQAVIAEGFAQFEHDEGSALAITYNSLVEVAASDTMDVRGPLTIELWASIGLMKVGDARSMLIDADEQFALSIKADGNLECKVGDKRISSGPDFVTSNVWHHYACTWDGLVMLLYVDGEPIEAVEHPGLRFDHEPIGAILVGASMDDGERDDTFTGAIDELRVFARALSEGEIYSIVTP